MSRYVTSVELVFENCDYLTIESKDIGIFYLGDINKMVRSLGCNDYITEESFANEVYIEIFKSADKEHYPFSDKEHDEYKTTVFNRIITWNDITNITLKYNDNTEEYYIIDYDEEKPNMLGSPNKRQHNAVAKNGNLYVVISKSKKIEDVFDWVEFENGK